MKRWFLKFAIQTISLTPWLGLVILIIESDANPKLQGLFCFIVGGIANRVTTDIERWALEPDKQESNG